MNYISIQVAYEQLKLKYQRLPPSLKKFQIETVEALCQKKDVLLLTPTSSGKTLPLVLAPLIMSPGTANPITIMILPLDSLMTDMVRRITGHGLHALTYKPSTFTLNKFASDVSGLTKPTFLLFSPEVFLMDAALQGIFALVKPCLLVVDEAHVVFTWGCAADKNPPFRKAYSTLSALRSFTKAPMICATATTTAEILKRIKEKCCLIEEKLRIIVLNPDRANIFIRCVNGPKDYDSLKFILKELVEGHAPKTLIFCDSYMEIIAIFYYLWNHLEPQKRIQTICGTPHYRFLMHSGSTDSSTKDVILQDFGESQTCEILISTISFGMGLDVQGIRRVIIWGMPLDAISLWQEIGRAGRDNLPSAAIIYTFKTRAYYVRKSDFQLAPNVCYRNSILKNFYKFNEVDIPRRTPCIVPCSNECFCNCCTCCDVCSSQCTCSK